MLEQTHTPLLHRIMKWLIILLVVGMVVQMALGVAQNMTRPQVVVVASKTTFQADIAKTDTARRKGLSGRKGLSKNKAMLFVFERDDYWPFWMKDVDFPIDIIWLDKDKKVVYVAEKVEPDPEPYDVYKPSKPARYVLEVAAGSAKTAGLTVGAKVSFDEEKLK